MEGWKGERVEALYVPCKTSKAVSGLEGCGPSQPLKPLWALFRLEFPFFDLFVIKRCRVFGRFTLCGRNVLGQL